jgi:uncharacterized protein involved in outer membrane biogenesis
MTDAAAITRRDRHLLVRRLVLLVVAVLFIALVAVWDWDWFKGPVERRVTAATGRTFRIHGHLDVDLSRIIVVRATGLSLQNAKWSRTAQMSSAELLRIEIPFWPLLRGQRILRRTDIVRPALLLERNGRGEGNWQFSPQTPAPRKHGPGWSFSELRIHDGRLTVRDAPFDTNLELTVNSELPQRGAESVRLLFRGAGRYRSQPFKLDGWADSPVALLERADAAYRLDVSARAGATRARVHGALPVPLNPAHFVVDSELSGNDLADLYPLLGLAIPSSPPYRIAGQFERDGRVVALHGMRGRVGDSDLEGDTRIDLSGAKPFLKANLVSTRLDLDDLGGLLGLPPGSAEGESASPEQRAEAARRKAGPKLLPDRDYNLTKLRAIDADVRLSASHIDAGKWPIESLASHLQLRDALLHLDPLDVGFAGGKITGSVRLDARQSPIDAATKVDVRAVDLERMFPNLQPPNIGRVNGSIDLHGHGNSIAAMFGTADGEAQLGMGQGRFSNLLLELAGLDVAESLKFLMSKDHTVKLRCAYGDFPFEQGVMKARAAVFDTTDTVVFGSGKANFADETLDLEIKPEPKDFSPVSLRGPIEINGTFKHPSFLPKPKPLLARVAAAAALFTVAPPAALIALIETGPGENVDCHGLGPVKKTPDTTEADQKRDDGKPSSKDDKGKSKGDNDNERQDSASDAEKTPEPKPPKHQ